MFDVQGCRNKIKLLCACRLDTSQQHLQHRLDWDKNVNIAHTFMGDMHVRLEEREGSEESWEKILIVLFIIYIFFYSPAPVQCAIAVSPERPAAGQSSSCFPSIITPSSHGECQSGVLPVND